MKFFSMIQDSLIRRDFRFHRFTLNWIFGIFIFLTIHISEGSRIKDLATIKGARENLLIGYGLVVGLKGSGDSSSEVTSKSLGRFFERMGLPPSSSEIKSKNIAAVIVSSKLPPFARAGTKVDVQVASIGDASSLEGGTLLITPLRAGDQNVYGVAQGAVTLGATTDGSGKTFPTSGRVSSGATIEREIEGSFTQKKTFVLSLHQPDFTTAARISKIINSDLGGQYATARDSGTIDLISPFDYESKGVELVALVENMQVTPDTKARIIINEKTGTVVIGDQVRIDPVALAHGDLTIEIPAPAGGGGGAKGKGKGSRVSQVDGTSLKDIVNTLNALGAKPSDMSAIFQALRASGALHAELEIQ